MKNTFGTSITVTLFGESHGEAIGAVLDGIAPGIKIDNDYIAARMDERRPSGSISTERRERDLPEFVSGVYNGYTTGTPICILIKNSTARSSDYESLRDTPRPSHADYTAEAKYHGFQDHRGGGHFSGRITAALVAAGAIVRRALESKNIFIGTHIARLGGINDASFDNYAENIKALCGSEFPTIDKEAARKMIERIEGARDDGDSVGGVLETAVIGVPAGVGEPWFDTVEGVIAHAMYSIPAVKGVEFGAGFAFSDLLGSEANDPFLTDGQSITTLTNNNGGVNGGISNGMPIIFRTAVKPTPSIFKEQDTVSLSRMENTKLSISGRHDPAIIHRARAVVDALTALSIADLLASRFGTDYLA